MKLAAPTLILSLILAAPFERCEIEPNDDLESATPVTPFFGGTPAPLTDGFRRNGVAARGRLARGDVDYFALGGREGEVLTLSVVEGGRGELHDPVLAVFGPGDTEPAFLVDDAGPGFLPRLAFPVDRTGTWTVAVAGFGDEALDGTGNEQHFGYRLLLAAATEPPIVEERDPAGANDDPDRPDRTLLREARLQPRGAAVITGVIEPGDVDHFLVPAPPHAVLTASVFDEEGGAFNDSVLRVLDLDGTLLAEDDDSGPGFLSNLSLATDQAAAGKVVVAVTGFDGDPSDERPHEELFRYRLVLSLTGGL